MLGLQTVPTVVRHLSHRLVFLIHPFLSVLGKLLISLRTSTDALNLLLLFLLVFYWHRLGNMVLMNYVNSSDFLQFHLDMVFNCLHSSLDFQCQCLFFGHLFINRKINLRILY